MFTVNRLRKCCVALAMLLSGSSQALAQSDVAEILGSGFVLDQAQTATAGKGLSLQTDVMFGKLPDYSSQVQIFRFDGTFGEAVRAIQVPSNALTNPSSPSTAGTILGLTRLLLEEQLTDQLGSAWATRAEELTQTWDSIPAQSHAISIGMDKLQTAAPGERLTLISINCMSPLIDIANLKVTEGTWAAVITASFRAPEGGAGDELASLLGEDDEGSEYDEEGLPGDLGVALFPGSRLIDSGGYGSELQGEWNYLAEQSLDAVQAFYLKSEGRHCYLESEGTMATDDAEIPMNTIYCLTHEGPANEDGDDIVAVTLMPAPAEMVGFEIGRNQGTWTLISFSHWTE